MRLKNGKWNLRKKTNLPQTNANKDERGQNKSEKAVSDGSAQNGECKSFNLPAHLNGSAALLRTKIIAAPGRAALFERIGGHRNLIAGRLFYSRATMHKFNPFQVMCDEVIESRCCHVHTSAVCKCDHHLPPPQGIYSFADE
jgi:hypothetical protein